MAPLRLVSSLHAGWRRAALLRVRGTQRRCGGSDDRDDGDDWDYKSISIQHMAPPSQHSGSSSTRAEKEKEADPATPFETRLAKAVRQGSFSECASVVKDMQEHDLKPTARIYSLLLQLYSDKYASDPEMCYEGAKVTFEKAHDRQLTRRAASLWSLMMMVHSKAGNAGQARALDRLRESCSVPVPEGSLYTDALKSSIAAESPRKLPPAGLRHDRAFNKGHLRNTMQRVRDG
ncbi:hypothetical protein DIPPA_34694 [Diplonema papillatum]|nr:hypothetical protein DIPPA_34694 [Diplonema papillatum]|eukprot:gene20612-31750_t